MKKQSKFGVDFKIRCSAIHDIMGGTIGLTKQQKLDLEDYKKRELGIHPKGLKLTPKMENIMEQLSFKESNPQLPQGAKTYCKKWLKETIYKRREQISSKYIDKGNATEEDGFTLMALQLKLGMVYKNEEFKENDFMAGTCDLPHNGVVYDNKSSWSLDQFPMYETECPDQEYIDQVQGYMHLWNMKKGAVVYTLNDCPEDILRIQFRPWQTDEEKQNIAINLVFTRDYWDHVKESYFPSTEDIDFVEIPEEKRVKPFYLTYDPGFIKDVEYRVELCDKYIKTLI